MPENPAEPLTAVRTLKEVYDYLMATNWEPTVEVDYAGQWYEITMIGEKDDSEIMVQLFPQWDQATHEDAIVLDLAAHTFRRVRFA